MVNFGIYLQSFRNPAWADFYFDYSSLKDLLYSLHNVAHNKPTQKQVDFEEGRKFEKTLMQNLEKINSFFLEKKEGLQQTFASLEALEQEGEIPAEKREEAKKKFQNLYIDINLLRDFANLNYTGISKLLKKHDKLLPEFKMKSLFFRSVVNPLQVFGSLDDLLSLQAKTLNLYSELFHDFNRIDAEISFGEALAKATGDFARVASLENKKKMIKKGIFTNTYQMELGGEYNPDFQVIAEKKAKKKGMLESALWQRARVTMMAVNSVSSENDSFLRQLILALLLVLFGGIGQSLFLEYMVKIDPGCGSTITFFSFLFIAVQGLTDFTFFKLPENSDGSPIQVSSLAKWKYLRMKPLKIPLIYHAGCVLMSWLSAVLSAEAFRYNISVPFHMVFKSSILLVNMSIGMLVLRKRYTFGQAGSVFW